MRLVRSIVLFALLALALAPTSRARAASPGTTLPESGPPGTRFVFIVEGFQSGERLSSWANTPDGRVVAYDTGAPSRARPGGSASWNWLAPEAIQPGAWQFVVHGLASGAERVLSFSIGAATPAAPAAPTNIEPASGRPGDIFRFYALGFTAGEPVDISVLAPDGRSTTAGLRGDGVAQAGGRVDGAWTAPLDISSYGTWQIMLRGTTSGVERSIPFAIEQPQAPSRPAPRVSPEVGRPGMLFIFSAVGFQAGEHLSAWLNTPDGRIVAVDPNDVPPATSDGRASWDWTAPADAAPGAWSMVIHGRASGIEQVAPFQILAAS